jgi:hypothetical protein
MCQLFGAINELGLHCSDVNWWVMSGEGNGQVVFAGPIVHQKLALACAVFDPMLAHVHGLRAFLFHGAIGKTLCGGVVYLHWGWWLRVAQLGECANDGHSVLAIQIASANFGFRGGANDDIDDLAHGMHRTI